MNEQKIFKDEDRRLIFGFASAADITDSQGDTISAETLETAAYNFVINSRIGSEMHSGEHVADLIESFFITPDKAEILGISSEHVGKWFVGFKINDESVWQKIKGGDYKMLSISGRCRRIQNG